MRYFLFVSFYLFCCACTRQVYRNKEEINLSQSYTAAELRPKFDKELYRCVVDGKFALKKFHLSGILYLRTLPDSTTRVVFQGEMGNTFFDFGWNQQDSFTVYSIVDQMNKAALIKTLKKDFELLLVKRLSNQPSGIYRFGGNHSVNYVRFELEKGFVYYVTDTNRRLVGIENADEQQKVVLMDFYEPVPLQQLSQEITIRHLKAGFTIALKKIAKEDDPAE